MRLGRAAPSPGGAFLGYDRVIPPHLPASIFQLCAMAMRTVARRVEISQPLTFRSINPALYFGDHRGPAYGVADHGRQVKWKGPPDLADRPTLVACGFRLAPARTGAPSQIMPGIRSVARENDWPATGAGTISMSSAVTGGQLRNSRRQRCSKRSTISLTLLLLCPNCHWELDHGLANEKPAARRFDTTGNLYFR
jgi:hypothetical protein